MLRCAPHCLTACSVSLTQSRILMFYLICRYTLALPCLRVIIKYLQS
ncbi:MAG: hypothetical protein NZ455_02350 [Bacteroidia bacterium]|nr:hypothetical protein [Bacteroidia bacterium]